jgi:5'-nucleotidase
VAASGVTIAIANGGGMRASLVAGKVTLDDIFGVLPFQNTLFTMELTGAQIIVALEQGVSRVEIRTGSFPQVAGLRVRFNPLVFAGRGRITEVRVHTRDGWVPIDPAAGYSVVVSNFMAAGGDGYSVLTEGRNRYDTAIDMADALAEFLSANASYPPRLDGRIAR